MDRQEQKLYFCKKKKIFYRSTFKIIIIIFHIFSIILFSSVGWLSPRPCHDWRSFEPRFLFCLLLLLPHSRTLTLLLKNKNFLQILTFSLLLADGLLLLYFIFNCRVFPWAHLYRRFSDQLYFIYKNFKSFGRTFH